MVWTVTAKVLSSRIPYCLPGVYSSMCQAIGSPSWVSSAVPLWQTIRSVGGAGPGSRTLMGGFTA
eukprot:12892259-Prorocentrum_lima.AAC.1